MEGARTEKKNMIFQGKDLIDIVSSWSLEDILNRNLYKDKVEKVPDSFTSVQHYLGAYVYPLLEETREELSSSMEFLSTAPYCHALSIVESKPLGYDITFDYWRNANSKEPYQRLPGDVFLISNINPSKLSQLKHSSWTLAWVPRPKNGNLEGCTFNSLKFKVAKEIVGGDCSKNPLKVIFLMNILTNNRIWESIHLSKNIGVIKEVLSPKCKGEEICQQCCTVSNPVLPETVLKELTLSLNESQKGSVLSSFNTMNCTHKCHVKLIWGPPGTGKTKTVSMLLWLALEMNCKVLTCAPTNIAITSLASRTVKQVKDSFIKVKANYQSSILFYPLGDMLMIGTKDRLRFGPDLDDIYLDYRVDRLSECFSPLYGWKKCFGSMIEFFSCPVFSNGVIVNSLAEFLRERFQLIALPLRRCIHVLCTHTPKSVLLEHNIESLLHLIELLYSFEAMLSCDDFLPGELEKLFWVPVLVENDQSLSSSALNLSYKKYQCHCVMRALQDSLDSIEFPSSNNNDQIKKFCVRNASLIFCTVGTSSKLRKLRSEKLQLLVIDEAAQLKECESMIALQLPGIRHAILFGDECQLPATVKSWVSENAGYGRSLFERLSSMGYPKHLLNTQYRMNPMISCFPNSKIYLNRILDAPCVKNSGYAKCYLQGPMFGSYSFINVSGTEQPDHSGHSLTNLVEVAVVIQILQSLYNACSRSEKNVSVGVVSPYAAQVVAIQEKLGFKYDSLKGFTVKVKSIDGFQGGEEDIIIISTVRSNTNGSIGFVSNRERTNVALTRARHCLWILGNESTLTSSGSIWDSVIRDAQNRQCFFHADADKDLEKAILNVKEELGLLDDLLCKDSLLFRGRKWKVLISAKFEQSLKTFKSIQSKKPVIIFLLKLSKGWRLTETNKSLKSKSKKLVINQFKIEGLCIVWTIDIEKDLEYTQVLKIWDILPLEDVPVLVKSLKLFFKTYTTMFCSHCKGECTEGDLAIPMTWPYSCNLVKFKDKRGLKKVEVEENLSAMIFYSLSYRLVEQLLSGHECEELGFLHHFTDQELEIVRSPKSIFMVGRSCSRKISLMTTKLFQKERHNTTEVVLRQLFVSVNGKKCAAVRKHLSDLNSFINSGKLSTESESIDMEDMDDTIDSPFSLWDAQSKPYPLVITFQMFLMMLDETIGNSFFERFHEVKVHSCYRTKITRSFFFMNFIRQNEVNEDRFILSYWPKFDTHLTKNLDASTVFTEITYNIKGALPSCSRESYVQNPSGPGFISSKKKRENIYDIFLLYEMRKTENSEFDWADIVIDLHHRMENNTYEGDKFDFVYVDEIQYLTKKEITLFKYVCKNIDGSLHFFADTAETIANRTGFQLRDAQSLICKELMGRSADEAEIADILYLNQTFDTSGHILKISQSVINLLFRFFPRHTDIVCPEMESCLVNAETPVLLEPAKDESVITTIFGNNQRAISFGADQVILVRDALALNEIESLVGNKCIVLTVMECQGLEFQDVLLYNFFGSSPLKSQCGMIYEYMKEQDLLDPTSPNLLTCINQARHDQLFHELKLIYYAITRSKHRLWICENVEDLSNPLFEYWKKLGLIQIKQADSSFLQSVQVLSNDDQWTSRGIKLYCENRNEMAMMCFNRAGDKHKENWAKAASLRRSAKFILDSNSKTAYDLLNMAAEIYTSIGRFNSAAQCFIQSKQYDKAGKIYLENCGDGSLEDAGDCFFIAGSHNLAAEAYGRGNYLGKILSMCTSIGRNNPLFDYIQSCSSPGTEVRVSGHDFLIKCALHYHDMGDKKTMLKIVKFFHSMDSKRDFLKNLNCLDELLSLERDSGNFTEAVAIAGVKGDLLLEADLLETARRYKDACLLILLHVFSKSLWASGNKGWPIYPIKRRDKLLAKAMLLAKKHSNVLHEIVCSESSILSTSLNNFSEVKQIFLDSQRQGNLRGIILSAWKILEFPEEKVSQNRVYTDTLFDAWNIMKEKIVNVVIHLGSVKSKECNESTSIGEFCLNYFGVRNSYRDGHTLHRLLIQDASWTLMIGDGQLQKNGEFVYIDAPQFIFAAKTYWCSEVVSLSLKILSTLQNLFSSNVCQAKIATNIFKVAYFLAQSDFLVSYINVESLQSVFDTGLKSIIYLKNAAKDDVLAVEKQKFLEKCAVHYHTSGNKQNMMKFVKAFLTLDSQRLFLSTLDCFDELLLLEEESGTYAEALHVAYLKGDILLEADLLAKTGSHKIASKLILFYVFYNSVWVDGSNGLPLKSFKNKGNLLKKAKLFAKRDSILFYNLVCTEAIMLSNKPCQLNEIKQNLDSSHSQKNPRGIILSAWKILDTHFQLNPSKYEWGSELLTDSIFHSEEMVRKNRASVITLVHFWDFWKEKIFDIFEYLALLQDQSATENRTGCEDFLLSYMGVRKENHMSKFIYILLNSKAEWLREVRDASLKKTGKLFSLEPAQFISAARNYWSSEVLSVGAKVLETLTSLYVFSITSSLPVLSQSMAVFHFFEVAKFLTKNKFLESANDKLVQNIDNLKQKFIQYCTQHAVPQGTLLNNNIQENADIVLQKYALQHYKLQDKRNMMKFVDCFSSLESKRLFLEKLNCFDGLLSLESELGNFKDAVILILSHVLTNSIWTPGSKGWPLKHFGEKEDLLRKAKSLATKESSLFFESVCTEVNVLAGKESSLSEMEEQFNLSRKNDSMVGEILSARQILDAHLISDISKYEWDDNLTADPIIWKERICIERLVCFWNFWVDKIANVFKYLEDVSKYSSYQSFSLSYLGAKKFFDEKSNLYFVVDPCAGWVSGIGSLRMDGAQFADAARSYWSSELLSVSIKVLKMLSSLHTFSLWNSFSLFRQSMPLLHIFNVTKFLMGSDFLERSCHDSVLKFFSELSTRHIFENLFPLDRYSNLSAKNMTSLRMSRHLGDVVEKIILEDIDSRNELTFGKIGRVVMVILGSGKLSTSVYKMVVQRFGVNPWNGIICHFKEWMGSKSVNNVYSEGSLVIELHNALLETFKVDFTREVDCMSPNCFLYLIDRLLFLVSYNHEIVFTTKSSFAEWLVCQEVYTVSITSKKSSDNGVFDFLASVVNQLLANKFDTMEWIKRSNLELKYYRHMVLRLVVVICLVCLYSGKHCNLLQNLIDMSDMSSFLTPEFSEFLQDKEKLGFDFDLFVKKVGKALAKIGDPLVIVSLKDEKKFSCSDAIFITTEDVQSREKLLEKLFMEKAGDVVNHGSVVKSELLNSGGVGFPTNVNHASKSLKDENISRCTSSHQVDPKKAFRYVMKQSSKSLSSSGSDQNCRAENFSCVDGDGLKTWVSSGFCNSDMEQVTAAVDYVHLENTKQRGLTLQTDNDVAESSVNVPSGLTATKMDVKEKKSNTDKSKDKNVSGKQNSVWRMKAK